MNYTDATQLAFEDIMAAFDEDEGCTAAHGDVLCVHHLWCFWQGGGHVWCDSCKALKRRVMLAIMAAS